MEMETFGNIKVQACDHEEERTLRSMIQVPDTVFFLQAYKIRNEFMDRECRNKLVSRGGGLMTNDG